VLSYVHVAPGVVQFHVNETTAGEAEVSWTPPLQSNGIITSYQVNVSAYENNFTTAKSEMLDNTTTSYIIRNLGKQI